MKSFRPGFLAHSVKHVMKARGHPIAFSIQKLAVPGQCAAVLHEKWTAKFFEFSSFLEEFRKIAAE